MSDSPAAASPGAALGGCLVLLVPILLIGSCVFDGPSKEDQERVAQNEADRQRIEARRALDIARYRDDPLLVESARKSPSGDAISYTISALGGRCGQAVSVTPLKTPMLYEVICSDDSASPRSNFTRYRLNTAAGISELLS